MPWLTIWHYDDTVQHSGSELVSDIGMIYWCNIDSLRRTAYTYAKQGYQLKHSWFNSHCLDTPKYLLLSSSLSCLLLPPSFPIIYICLFISLLVVSNIILKCAPSLLFLSSLARSGQRLLVASPRPIPQHHPRPCPLLDLPAPHRRKSAKWKLDGIITNLSF